MRLEARRARDVSSSFSQSKRIGQLLLAADAAIGSSLRVAGKMTDPLRAVKVANMGRNYGKYLAYGLNVIFCIPRFPSDFKSEMLIRQIIVN